MTSSTFDPAADRHLDKWSRTELLALPVRQWDIESEYDGLVVFSTRRKHESGWAKMAIIGVRNGVPVEIVSTCSDDLVWLLLNQSVLRMDCVFKSGVMHFWATGMKFLARRALSSIDIDLVLK